MVLLHGGCVPGQNRSVGLSGLNTQPGTQLIALAAIFSVPYINMADTLAKISSLDFAAASSLAARCESSPLLLQNFVDNKFVSPPLDTKWIDTYNPRTGKVFARVPSTADTEVEDAVAAAERAFPAWSQTPKSARSSLLIRIADLINERKESFAIWESIDQGKSIQRARVEIDRAESNFRYRALQTRQSKDRLIGHSV